MSKQDSTTHAYILAGGESRRLGSDKLFVTVDGATLIEKSLAVCGAVFPTVKISAREETKFIKFNVPVILDSPNARGPLAGIIAALSDCPDTTCFITAVDLCDLDEKALTSLLENYQGEDYLGFDEGAQKQPLCGIYAISALPVLQECAKKNIFQLQKIMKRLNARFVPVPKNKWRNINTASDLANDTANVQSVDSRSGV